MLLSLLANNRVPLGLSPSTRTRSNFSTWSRRVKTWVPSEPLSRWSRRSMPSDVPRQSWRLLIEPGIRPQNRFCKDLGQILSLRCAPAMAAVPHRNVIMSAVSRSMIATGW